MKLFLMSLLIAGAPQWLSSRVARACDTKEKDKNVFVVSGGKVGSHGHGCAKVIADGAGDAKVFIARIGDQAGPCSKCSQCKKCNKGIRARKFVKVIEGNGHKAKVFVTGVGDDFDFDFDFDGDPIIVKSECKKFKKSKQCKKCRKGASCGKCAKAGGEGAVDVFVAGLGKCCEKCCGKCCEGGKKGIMKWKAKGGDHHVNILHGGGHHPQILHGDDHQVKILRGDGPHGMMFIGTGDDEQHHGDVVIKKRIKIKRGDGPHVMTFIGTGDDDSNDKDIVIKKRMKIKRGGGCVELITDEGDDEGVFITAVGEGRGDGRSEPALRWVGEKKKEPKERGWLGVSIGPVPEALAAQLGIEGEGILVINVVEDSPADTGGLDVHDILISVDGEAIEGDTGRAVKLIAGHKPGDEVEIEVLRDGKNKTFVVELGAKGDVGGVWKVEVAPDAEVEHRVRTRGKIMRKGPGGKWVIEDLGDLEKLQDLPKHIRKFMPKSGSRTTQVFVDGGSKKIKTRVERDGSVIVVRRDGDGPIIVERVADGDKSEASYDSEDDLRAGDEEAYDLWEEMGDSVVVKLDLDDIDMRHIEIPDIEIPDFTFEFDPNEWKEHAEEWKEQGREWKKQAGEWKEHVHEWREHLEESLSEANEARERALGHLHEALEKWKAGEDDPDEEFLEAMPWMLFDKESNRRFAPFGPRAHFGKPRHSFEVRTDGTIEVKIRKGDSELVQLFEDQDDLADRSPKLYKKYERLMSADTEDE